MSDSSDFDYSAYIDTPTTATQDKTRNWLRKLVALVMIVALVGGTGYGAFQFMLDTFWGPDNFTAILTSVEIPQSNKNCNGVKQVNPVGSIEPTRTLCVCGQLLADGVDDVSYYLRIKDIDDKVVLREKFKEQQVGEFCQRMTFEKTLANGRYVLEISAAKRSEAIAWYRFSVRVDNRQA